MSDNTRLKLGIPPTVKVPEDILEKLKNIRPAGPNYKPAWATDEIDNLIYYTYEQVNKHDLAAAIGVSSGTLRKRYRQLLRERGPINPDESSENNSNDG